MHYLYKITNQLNQKIYIGQTIDEKRRWQAHKSYAKNPERTGQYIHRAMAKYGVDSFIYEVIAICLTQQDTDETEIQLIKQYDSRNKEFGYNIRPGGETMSEEERKVLSEGMMGNTYCLGNIETEEHKQNISKAMLGKQNSLGTIRSEEFKQNLSQINSGKNHPQFGISKSEETKRKISETKKGRTWKLINGKRVYSNKTNTI